MGDGTEPIEDDEYLYRRIPLAYFDVNQGDEPSPHAFHPRQYDETGISVFRARYTTTAPTTLVLAGISGRLGGGGGPLRR
jgi:hypothetical protein